ncbi:hypothetical protein [Halobacillus salinus]|uniref:Uncharacterized protein n=1 Tax=Halobacillus salinus TaxID=192814 RepID=A0A4Z0GU60_9BACI|nr:hypothetical protein [Halobacillus salinus]TGB01206.1 hypothetical protein E4663_17155 [Halobacillus salinus]
MEDTKIKWIERKIRPFFFSAFLSLTMCSVIIDYFEVNGVLKWLFPFAISFVLLPVGGHCERSLASFFHKDFNWESLCEITEGRVLRKVVQGLEVTFISFYIQLVIAYIYIPSLFQVEVWHTPLFWPFAVANIGLLITFYNQFIWRDFSHLSLDSESEV